MSEPTRYVLTFTAIPGDVPPTVRLRHLLKYALRAQGFRCESVEQPVEAPAETDDFHVWLRQTFFRGPRHLVSPGHKVLILTQAVRLEMTSAQAHRLADYLTFLASSNAPLEDVS